MFNLVTISALMWALFGLLFALTACWFVYWQIQGWLLSHRSGHYAPMITVVPRFLRWMVGCAVAWYYIGPVRIVGWDNIKDFQGRLMVAPKHVRETDAVLVAKLARTRKLRFLIAINQTKFPRSAPLAWMGAISVGYDKNNPALSGANAVRSAVKAMTEEADTILLVFPEGKLDRENKLLRENVRGGTVRIGLSLHYKRPEQNWHIAPVDVQYVTDPSKATRFQRLVERLGMRRRFLGNKVYGAVVTYGKPIAVATLPDDEELGTDILFSALAGLRQS